MRMMGLIFILALCAVFFSLYQESALASCRSKPMMSVIGICQ